MIQILGLRKFTNEQGKEIKFDKLLEPRANTVASLFANADKILASLPKAEHVNLYYTAATCGEGKREFKEQGVVPFDIDHIDPEQLDAYVCTFLDCFDLDKNKTGIAFTGHGLQFLVGITKPITEAGYFERTRPHYKILLNKLARALEAAGLKGEPDIGVWDHRRLLRFPGSINDKSEKGLPPVQGRLIAGVISAVDFDVVKLSGMPEVLAKDEVPADFMKRYPKVDTAAVLDGCAFLKWAKANPNNVSEPAWYAALSITARLEDGVKHSHELSKGYKGYSEHETNQKIEQSLACSGPRTCKNIESLWDGCPACPHFGKVSSPILIRGANYLKTEGTGFRHVSFEDGKLKIGKPCFEDLAKYLERTTHFKVLGGSRICYTWRGTHYAEMEKPYLEAFAQDNIVPPPEMKHRKEFTDLISTRNITPVNWFNETTNRKINFRNGVYSIDTKNFLPAAPQVGFRHVLPYDYEPNAKAPRFMQLMADITMGDKSLEKIILEFCGYALSNDRPWAHKALVLTGSGANGKSTLMNILRRLAGEGNYCSLTLKDLQTEYNRQIMDGKLFNVAEETPTKSVLDSSIFKTLVSGGEVQARQPYKGPYVFTNKAKLLFACNDLPQSLDASDGYFRRLIIAPCNAKFTAEAGNLDPHVEEKIEAELAGVFNIMMAHYADLVARKGFPESRAVAEQIEEYRTDVDTVKAFVDDYVEVFTNGGMDSARSRVGDMYNAYVVATKAGGKLPIDIRVFGRRLAQLIPNYAERYRQVKEEGRAIRILQGVKFAEPFPMGPRVAGEKMQSPTS